jgi:hypothetical protein
MLKILDKLDNLDKKKSLTIHKMKKNSFLEYLLIVPVNAFQPKYFIFVLISYCSFIASLELYIQTNRNF